MNGVDTTTRKEYSSTTMPKLIMTLLMAVSVAVAALSQPSDLFHAVRVAGLVELSGVTVVENESYPIQLPVKIVTRESSAVAALLPNSTGLYVKPNSEVTLDGIGRERTPEGFAWAGILWMTVVRGDFSLCSPEQAALPTRTRVTARGVVLIGSEQSTYVILGDVLTVTRGSVDVHDSKISTRIATVQAGEMLRLSSPWKVEEADRSDAVTQAVLESTVEACSARLAAPEGVAEPVRSIAPFPIQPINPDIVSPSS